jgi:ribonuclease P protein component
VAFVVSRKVGKAVVRNRVRRRLRESLRSMLQATPAGASGSGPDGRWPLAFDALVIVRPSAAEASYDDLASALRRSLDAAAAGAPPGAGAPLPPDGPSPAGAPRSPSGRAGSA